MPFKWTLVISLKHFTLSAKVLIIISPTKLYILSPMDELVIDENNEKVMLIIVILKNTTYIL